MQSVVTISYNPQYSACKSNAVCFFNDPSKQVARLKLPMGIDDFKKYVYFVIPSRRTLNQLQLLLSANINKPLPHYLKFLQVRRMNLINALKFLKINNPYYHDVIIDVELCKLLPLDSVPHEIISGFN